MHILASCPELQAVRFGYVILGEKLKRYLILNICRNIALHKRSNKVSIQRMINGAAGSLVVRALD
jgi:hypothetical protein